MTVQRCPFCGALLDVEWSKAHAPHCPNRNPLPTEVLGLIADYDRRDGDLEALLPPGAGAPQGGTDVPDCRSQGKTHSAGGGHQRPVAPSLLATADAPRDIPPSSDAGAHRVSLVNGSPDSAVPPGTPTAMILVPPGVRPTSCSPAPSRLRGQAFLRGPISQGGA